MQRILTFCVAVGVTACTSLTGGEALASPCEFSLKQFDEAKDKISEQSKVRHPKDVIIEVGNTQQSVSLGQLIGFNGDYILEMGFDIPADCKLSENLKTDLMTDYKIADTVSELTLLWSSWKDPRIEVIADYSGDLRDYFTPPNN